MAHFSKYSTNDGDAALGAGGIVTLGPIQSGTLSKIAGSVYSDQGGTLLVQQSFDGTNWDLQNSITVAAATVNTGIDLDVVAPYLQLKYTNGGTPNTVLRIFVRVFGSRNNT